MSPWTVGAILGLAAGGGLAVLAAGLLARRHPSLDDRLVPYLHDVASVRHLGEQRTAILAPTSVGWSVFGPAVRRAARTIERLLGGSTSIRLRLARLGSDSTVEEFRTQQVIWGATGFLAAAAALLVMSLRRPIAPVPALLACVVVGAVAVLGKDSHLSRLVRDRERRMVEEFPTIADLMALSVAAGEGPVASLERVVAASHGELSGELRRVLSAVRTGTPVTRALDELAARTGLASVARFAEGLAVAIERGTPLVDVLHAQAADVREAGRRALIEAAARKEVAMMLPVVFLILPVTIVFAFYPGVIGLHLTSP